EDVDLKADAPLGVLDRLVRGAQRLAVLIKLHARAVGEMDGMRHDPAVVIAAGRDVHAGGSTRLALTKLGRRTFIRFVARVDGRFSGGGGYSGSSGINGRHAPMIVHTYLFGSGRL